MSVNEREQKIRSITSSPTTLHHHPPQNVCVSEWGGVLVCVGVLLTMHKLYPHKPKNIVKVKRVTLKRFDSISRGGKWGEKEKIPKHLEMEFELRAQHWFWGRLKCSQPIDTHRFNDNKQPITNWIRFKSTNTHWVWIKWKAIRITNIHLYIDEKKIKQVKLRTNKQATNLDHFWLMRRTNKKKQEKLKKKKQPN